MSISSRPAAERVLLVAFHFPPLGESSGLLRSFCFARDLLTHGWEVRVLTVNPRVHATVRQDLLERLPKEVDVEQVFALDAATDMSLFGRYPDWLALPDRWWSWALFAGLRGLWKWRQWRPKVVWSTYPIATAHLIGCFLSRVTGTPWVADFRDPMVEQNERTGEWVPRDARLRGARLWVEALCARHATALVFCTESARQICVERYGRAIEDKCFVIANGYDEESFRDIESAAAGSAPVQTPARITLLHSGVIYDSPDRDPSAFFAALARLKQHPVVKAGGLCVRLRASGNDRKLGELARQSGCDDMVELVGSVPYHEALREMMAVDGLLIFQGYTSNPAIPAKLYEYLRTGRPIFAMAHAQGETARLVHREKAGVVVDLEDSAAIELALASFLGELRAGRARGADGATVRQHARAARAEELAGLLRRVVAGDGQTGRE